MHGCAHRFIQIDILLPASELLTEKLFVGESTPLEIVMLFEHWISCCHHHYDCFQQYGDVQLCVCGQLPMTPMTQFESRWRNSKQNKNKM